MVGEQDSPVSFGQVAIPLIQWGWRPVPLHPGSKKPSDIGWSRLNREPWPENELGLMLRQFGNHACGLAIPSNLLAVDIDILTEDVAFEVQRIALSHFGETPLIRIGQAPKSVLIFRSDGTCRSQKPHPLEMFSGTGQIASFGIHVKTRSPYQWPIESPLSLRADSDEIPLVTGKLQHAFLHSMRGIVTPRNPTRRNKSAGRSPMEPNDPGAYLRDLMSRGLKFHRAVPYLLGLADVGQRHACVRAVVSAGFNSGLAAEEIEVLIRRYASDDTLSAVEGDGYLSRTLRDFQPQFKRQRV